jgi:molecular chaperone HscB
MQNHFDLFQLPQQFAIDLSALDKAYRNVQSRVHPDKFVSSGDAEKRVAMQWATRANEAYQTLKSPLKRATYLCHLHGVDLQAESNTAMPRTFLMQQMEWRETLEDAKAARNVGALDSLDAELRSARQEEITQIGALLDTQDYVQAAQAVRQLMFLEKIAGEISHQLDLIAHT